tara:strand:+ start:1336 stop:2259 length:924 start_codon:yes stop_codon:yes gene_type:complete
MSEPIKTPKKRGRKPKNKKLDDEPKEKKIPKKRGRKPKEVVTNQKQVIKEEPIILHLPIKGIDTDNQIFVPKPFVNNNNFNQNYKNINSNPNKSVDINTSHDTVNKFKKLCSEYNNVIERDKVLPVFLEFSEYNKKNEWPSQSNIDCLWCCHSFDNFPFGIPIKKIDNKYHMFGNFCSSECAAAYNFDNLKTCEAFERYSMLNYLYSFNKKIKPAAPRLTLKKFGGQLSINEFRKNNNVLDKNYKLLLPPMISLIPTIEEVNINENNTNSGDGSLLNLTDNELKLKRSKPLPDYCNTLENCMNLKLV